MHQIALVEIVSAVFLCIILLRLNTERKGPSSGRYLRISLLLCICSLIVDAMAYTLIGAKYPVALRYIINLLSFEAGTANVLAFTLYTRSFITEKGKINPWVFRSLIIFEILCAVAIALEFITGRFVTYNNGIENVDYSIPVYLQLATIAIIIYLSVVVFLNRKIIGHDMALLFCTFNISPVIGVLVGNITDYNFAYVFDAFAIALVVEFLQRKQMQEHEKQQQALSDGLAREYHTVWLMDGFGSHNLHLFRSTGRTTVQSAVQLGLNQPCFDTFVVKYIRDNVLEEDQERVIEETRFETVERETPETGTYVVTYRRYTNDRSGYTYHQMCFAKATGADGKVNYILAYRDADKMMREQIAQQKQLEDALDSATIEAQRNEVLIDAVKGGRFSYKLNSDDKVIEAVYSEISRNRIGAGYLEKMEWIKLLHPDDRERVIEKFENCIHDHTGGTPYDATFRMKGTDGNYRWVRSGGKLLRRPDGSGELYGISLDITEQMNEEARHEKELVQALNRANEEAVLRNMIYEISDSSQWLYEISSEDEVLSVDYSDKLIDTMRTKPSGNAMGWVRLVHPEDKDRVLAGFMAAILDHSGNTLYDESYRIMDMDGDYRWVRSTGRVFRREDGSGEFVGMATDFTEQFRQQEKQQEQLARALSMADAANKAKTDFLFNMSHDIRTPMNAIIGFTNIAKKEIDNREKALDSLEKVQTSSEILLNLINDVLDMSRIESGKAELHEEKYEILEVFDSFESTMASLAASKDIDLEFSIGKVRDRYVFADGPRFDRVLINIISNAIKYTPPEGFVKVSVDQIEDTKPGYGNYRFTVSDSGIGMSEEFQKHMFEDFTREENSTTSGIQGTGLGLSLARKLVDMMGGDISCVSRQGIGTTFTIIFPFRLQTEADIAQGRTVVKEHARIDLKGRKALLVEDNELNREIAGEILNDEGIIVDLAENGQKAVNRVRERGADYYDFILMDIQMPVMDGYEATRAIHKLMPDLKTPIIALSANAFAEDKKKSLEAGMDDHVAKPINVDELVDSLAKFL